VAMWKMTEFSKIVLMDYDGVVLKNMDFLLDFPDKAGSNDQAEDYGKSFRNLNTGVLVARPNPTIYQRYVEWVSKVQPDSGVLRLSEQGIHCLLCLYTLFVVYCAFAILT
jgi:alpha-N-acetylglucosamine transferase